MKALVRLLILTVPMALTTCALAQPRSHDGDSRSHEDPSFEAAAVSPTTGLSLCNLRITPGRLTAQTVSLHCLISKAYGVTDYELSGISGWMDADVYSITATSGKAVDTAEMMAMLRSLLAERFQLKVHTEVRKIPILALVINRGGPKFQPLAEGESTVPPANLSSPQRMTLSLGPTTSDLTRWLNFYSPRNLGRLVVDRTGLTGKYKIWVSFDNEMNAEGTGGKLDMDFQSALPQQLGLSLRPEQAEIPVVVIENAARPGSN
jgi:uncharacterized protein (TIGR03435 family)